MKEETAPQYSENKLLISCNVPAQSHTKVPKVKDERFPLTKWLLTKRENPFGRLVPIQYTEISKGLTSAAQWVRSAAGFPPHEDVKVKSKRDKWGNNGRSPTSLEYWSRNLLRKSVPGFPLNCAFYRMAALFNSVPAEDGIKSRWDKCVSCEDGIDRPGKAGNCFDMKVLVPTTLLELHRTSEEWQRDLEQLDLQAPLPSGKTNWDVIREVQILLRVILTILEATVNEVSSEFKLYKTSTDLTDDTKCYPEDNDDFDFYEALCNSFEEVSSTASERCFQALNLITICISEKVEITDYASAFLLPAALDLIDIYKRIRRAQRSLVFKKRKTLESTEGNSEQQKKAFDCVWKLNEAILGYIISLQTRVLRSDLVRQNDNGTLSKETLNIESRLRQTYTWLSKLTKQIATICPHKRKGVFVYLLEKFIEATEKLCYFQQLIWRPVKGKKKKLVASAVSSLHKPLLQCLAGLFYNAEVVRSELKRTGVISDCEFPQVSEASNKVSQLVTILLSTPPDQTGNFTPQSRHVSETAFKSGSRLTHLTKKYLDIVLSNVCENTTMTESVKKSLEKLCCRLCKIHDKLKSLEEQGVDPTSNAELRQSESGDHEEQGQVPSKAIDSKEPTGAVQRSSRASTRKHPRRSAFADRSNHLENEPPNDALVPVDSDTSLSNTNDSSQVVKVSSNVADDSLDRILPSLPSISAFGKANINAMTNVKYLGNGSSGLVSLMILETSFVALKMLTCPDSKIAKDRLEKESKIHQRINSHPNILRFLGRAVKTDEAGEDQILGIITEWCEAGNLSSAIKDAAWIQKLDLDGQDISFANDNIGYQLYTNWIKRLEVVAGIAAGMAYMHSCHVVHRDLTSANVLLEIASKSGRISVKVCDFERAYFLKDDEPIQRTKATSNSPPWMGLEVLKHEKYGLKADVHSIGTILWELMYLENPWSRLKEKCFGMDNPTIQCLLSFGITSLPMSEEDAPDDVPEFPHLVRLVKRAWARDPDSRPTMAEFYEETMKICARMKKRLDIKQNQSSVVTLHGGTL